MENYKIWIITNNDCPTGGYESAWRTEESARAELERLNAEVRAKYGRNRYELDWDELNG